MATENRLIYANALKTEFPVIGQFEKDLWHSATIQVAIDNAPTVDAVPVDDIRLHRILIDNEGVPEVKIQLGDRTLILRNEDEPVDVRQVVHGRWNARPYYKADGNGGVFKYCDFHYCSECATERPMVPPYNYCPNCGAKMDGDGNGKLG